jgi:putative acetyltransferase
MRAERDDILGLVAAGDRGLLGHVLFSPVILTTSAGPLSGMGLGQLAVNPQVQKQGIGSALALHGIQLLRDTGCPFIIVIGHASYYPRFGFERGSAHNLRCQWPGIPDDSFMVLLPAGPRPDLSGVASFVGL